jgi:hypothetical protein
VAVEAVEDQQEGPPDLAREEAEDRTKVSPLQRPVEVELGAADMGWSSNHLGVTGGRGNGVGIAIVNVIDTTEIEGGRGREVRVIGIEAGTIGIEIEKGGMAEAGIGNTVIDGNVIVWGSKSQ